MATHTTSICTHTHTHHSVHVFLPHRLDRPSLTTQHFCVLSTLSDPLFKIRFQPLSYSSWKSRATLWIPLWEIQVTLRQHQLKELAVDFTSAQLLWAIQQQTGRLCILCCITASDSDDTRRDFSGWVGPALVFVWQSIALMIPGMLLVAKQSHGRAGPVLCVCMAMDISDGTRYTFRGWAGPVLVFVWQLITWMTPGMLLVAEQAHGRAGPVLCIAVNISVTVSDWWYQTL